jgi:hypothetical protein
MFSWQVEFWLAEKVLLKLQGSRAVTDVPGIAVVEYKQHNVNTRKNTTSMLYLITINPILKVLANLK